MGARGALLPQMKIFHGFAPNGIRNLEIYVGKKASAPTKCVYKHVLPPSLGMTSSYYLARTLVYTAFINGRPKSVTELTLAVHLKIKKLYAHVQLNCAYTFSYLKANFA